MNTEYIDGISMSKLENNTIVHPPVEAAGLLQTDQGRHLYQVLEYIPHETPLLSNTPLSTAPSPGSRGSPRCTA